MPALIDALHIGPEKNFTYLIACPETKLAGLIDPSFDFDRVIKWVTSHGQFEIDYLIATHGHFDHAGGFPEMLKRLPKAKVVAHALEEKRMAQLGLKIDKKLKDGEVFDIGKVHVKSIHSPGHTEGGCCYLVENQIFTGDTLFVGTCGRTDFPGGSNEDLYASLNRLKKMPRDLRVRPGHDYGSTPVSTIGHEIATNPALMAKSLTEFEDIP